jgi:7-carboxy-7-deazaguanine synthase
MFGKNKPLPIKQDYNNNLDVVNIFKTIQGEGAYAGTPAIFIRLGGCNLKCSFCDTEFDDFSNLHIDDILKQITELAANTIKLVVITGGEPLRQDISELCELLIQADFKVQIETNGTIYRELNQNVMIICSPKNYNGIGYKHIDQNMFKRANYFKFIISATNKNYNHIPQEFAKLNNVYIQPMDEYNEKLNQDNHKLCVELALQYNYNISIQTHKILNIA